MDNFDKIKEILKKYPGIEDKLDSFKRGFLDLILAGDELHKKGEGVSLGKLRTPSLRRKDEKAE